MSFLLISEEFSQVDSLDVLIVVFLYIYEHHIGMKDTLIRMTQFSQKHDNRKDIKIETNFLKHFIVNYQVLTLHKN